MSQLLVINDLVLTKKYYEVLIDTKENSEPKNILMLLKKKLME